ncbi:MAG TPA: DUF1427 family protein [Rhodopila sp.]|nr:DUF1427 family protein [Rhodopila sp.]
MLSPSSWGWPLAWRMALVQVRSPAPPLIALVGLLGMVLGEQAVDMAKHRLLPPAHASIRHAPDDVRGPS